MVARKKSQAQAHGTKKTPKISQGGFKIKI